jgi:hypothetical protein
MIDFYDIWTLGLLTQLIALTGPSESWRKMTIDKSLASVFSCHLISTLKLNLHFY